MCSLLGTFGARPQGDIVLLAVLYQRAVDVVAQYGDALAGKILVDITNPFNADATGLVTTADQSGSSPSVSQVAAAGVGSVLPAGSVARTEKEWLPRRRPA
jgi:predicted dinucleotide-binding enzyme